MSVPRSEKVYKLSKVYVICRLVSDKLFSRNRIKTTDIAGESVFVFTPKKSIPTRSYVGSIHDEGAKKLIHNKVIPVSSYKPKYNLGRIAWIYMNKFYKSKWLGPCYKSKFDNEISDFQYLVSGTVEKDECMEDTVIREVEEEIGLKCYNMKLLKKIGRCALYIVEV